MQCFLRYFIEFQNIPRRKIRALALPVQGCGEQYVREEYPKELNLIRSINYNSISLFVCIDADTETLEKRKQELSMECKKQLVNERLEQECVAYFIPKRNIETWINFFDNNTKSKIDETTDYGHRYGHEAECKKAACAMSEYFQKENDMDSFLSSIKEAYKEFESLVQSQDDNK